MVWSLLLIASGCLAAWSFLQATPAWATWRRVVAFAGFLVPALTAIVLAQGSPRLLGATARGILGAGIGLGIVAAIAARALIGPRTRGAIERLCARRSIADRWLPVVFSLTALGASWLGRIEPAPLADLQRTLSFVIVALLLCGVLGSRTRAAVRAGGASGSDVSVEA